MGDVESSTGTLPSWERAGACRNACCQVKDNAGVEGLGRAACPVDFFTRVQY